MSKKTKLNKPKDHESEFRTTINSTQASGTGTVTGSQLSDNLSQQSETGTLIGTQPKENQSQQSGIGTKAEHKMVTRGTTLHTQPVTPQNIPTQKDISDQKVKVAVQFVQPAKNKAFKMLEDLEGLAILNDYTNNLACPKLKLTYITKYLLTNKHLRSSRRYIQIIHQIIGLPTPMVCVDIFLCTRPLQCLSHTPYPNT